MNGKFSNTWKKLLIWFSAYFSFIAFAIVGGYVVVKEDDEELKKTTKVAFLVTLIFAAISAFLSIYYNCYSLSQGSTSGAYDFYKWLSFFNIIGRIVTYAAFMIVSIFIKDKKTETKKVEEKKETEKVSENA